jgi:hypothetical protein
MRDRYGIKGQNWAASAFASVFGRSARITSARPLTRRRLETFRSRGPDTEQRLAMHAVPVQRTTSPTRAVFGEGAEWIGRADSAGTDEIGAAGRSNRTTTKPSEKGNCDHEADDHRAGLR